jgi:peptide/nickel transport system substrate-binding protein
VPGPAPAPQKSSRKAWWATLLILIILAALGYLAYSLSKTDNKPKASVANSKKDIAELNVGVINGSVDLYPGKNANDSYVQAVNAQIYEGLVRYQDQTKIVPLLATSWTNPDSTTWDFNIAPGVTFHNGDKLTADDVAYSLKMARDNETLSGAYADTIKDAKALNSLKVEVTTTAIDPFFLNKLTFLLILDSKTPNATDGSNGTGPYQLKPGTKPTSTGIQLVAYDKFHGGHVYTRALNFVPEADQAAAAKDFKAGKINFSGEYTSQHPDELKGANYQSLEINDPSVTFMTLNSQAAGPLQKKEVRQALRESIDIDSLLKATGISATPASQLITKPIPGYNPALSVPKADIAKAKADLAAAGYPNGVSLTIEASASNAQVANEIVKQAAAAGFTISVKSVDTFDQLVSDMIDGKTQLSMLAFSSDVLDGSDVFTQVIQQTANYKSATLDDYLKQAAATTDQAKRLDILQKTSKFLMDDVAAIPLFSRNRTWVMDKPYAIQFDTVANVPGVYFWQVYSTK